MLSILLKGTSFEYLKHLLDCTTAWVCKEVPDAMLVKAQAASNCKEGLFIKRQKHDIVAMTSTNCNKEVFSYYESINSLIYNLLYLFLMYAITISLKSDLFLMIISGNYELYSNAQMFILTEHQCELNSWHNFLFDRLPFFLLGFSNILKTVAALWMQSELFNNWLWLKTLMAFSATVH